MQLAPSKNPEKESKQFSTAALILGIGSLFIWFLALGGIPAGVRGAIISKRINNKKYLWFAIVGMLLSAFSIVYYYTQK